MSPNPIHNKNWHDLKKAKKRKANVLTSRMKVEQNSATASLIKGERRKRLAMEKNSLHCKMEIKNKKDL